MPFKMPGLCAPSDNRHIGGDQFPPRQALERTEAARARIGAPGGRLALDFGVRAKGSHERDGLGYSVVYRSRRQAARAAVRRGDSQAGRARPHAAHRPHLASGLPGLAGGGSRISYDGTGAGAETGSRTGAQRGAFSTAISVSTAVSFSTAVTFSTAVLREPAAHRADNRPAQDRAAADGWRRSRPRAADQ